MNNNTQLVPYEFSGDLKQFRLVAEPTLDAIKNDVQKFYEVTTRGADVMLLGRFLLGVSLIKAKKLVGNAKRGVHGSGDSGWMTWKKNFPSANNNALTDAVNFSNEVFGIWNKSLNSHLQILDPIAFQTPENPSELKGLLTAIRDSMDGKKMTAFCRSIGRIRDAIAPGSNSKGGKAGGDTRDLLDPLLEIENDLISLSGGKDLTYADLENARLKTFDRWLAANREKIKTIIASRPSRPSRSRAVENPCPSVSIRG